MSGQSQLARTLTALAAALLMSSVAVSAAVESRTMSLSAAVVVACVVTSGGALVGLARVPLLDRVAV